MTKDKSGCFLTAEDYKTMREYDPALPPLSGRILGLFKLYEPRWTLRDIASRSRASRATIRKRIGELIRAGLLRKHGKGKSTWYSL
jgi:predicted HTH transcriptional regulator